MVRSWKVIDINQTRNGLKTEPCGTPALEFIWLDKKPFTFTCITRPTKKSESQRVILVERSNWNILYLSPLCQTLSNAFFDVKKSSYHMFSSVEAFHDGLRQSKQVVISRLSSSET